MAHSHDAFCLSDPSEWVFRDAQGRRARGGGSASAERLRQRERERDGEGETGGGAEPPACVPTTPAAPWLAQVFGEPCFSNPILWRVWERTHTGARSAQVGLARVLKALFGSKSASGLQRKTQRPQAFSQPLSGCLAHAHVQSQLCFTVAAIIKHCLAKACYLLCKYIKTQNVKKTDNRLAHSYTPTLLVVQ